MIWMLNTFAVFMDRWTWWAFLSYHVTLQFADDTLVLDTWWCNPSCSLYCLEAILGWFNNVSWSREVPRWKSLIYNKRECAVRVKSWICLQHIISNCRRLYCSDDGKGSLFECWQSRSMYNLSRQVIPHTNCPREKGEFIYIYWRFWYHKNLRSWSCRAWLLEKLLGAFLRKQVHCGFWKTCSTGQEVGCVTYPIRAWILGKMMM